jgi:hypothetical protein
MIIGISNAYFVVPYERNEFFACRKNFLKQIIDKFNDSTPRPYHEENRRVLHQWMPPGIRPYSYSIAMTWSMSFYLIRKNQPQVAEHFGVLSFLNPDRILIDFLKSGATVFENNLRQVVLNQINLDNALIELERLSLRKWNRIRKTLLIHRLV